MIFTLRGGSKTQVASLVSASEKSADNDATPEDWTGLFDSWTSTYRYQIRKKKDLAGAAIRLKAVSKAQRVGAISTSGSLRRGHCLLTLVASPRENPPRIEELHLFKPTSYRGRA